MARGATARLFVAVDPPREACEELAEWAREAAADWPAWAVRRSRRPHRPPRLVKADSLHLTLCFLGSRPVGEIEALGAALRLCGGNGAELAVGAPLWLPPRRPRALAVEVRDRTGGLAALQASVAGSLTQASGWEPERRRFRPHITLARMRETAAPAAERPLLAPTPQLRFTVQELVLYRSMPSAGGSVYDPLASCELGPAGA